MTPKEEFDQLLEQKAQLQTRFDALVTEESALREQLSRVSEEKTEVIVQQQAVAVRAEELFGSVFGRPRPVEQPTPAVSPVAKATPRKPDNSVVFDTGVPIVAIPENVPAEKKAVDALNGFQF